MSRPVLLMRADGGGALGLADDGSSPGRASRHRTSDQARGYRVTLGMGVVDAGLRARRRDGVT